MSTDLVTRTEGTIVRDEPVIVAHSALWVVAVVGEFLVGRTHLVSSSEWSALSSTLVPILTTALLGVSATLMRSVVSPAAAFARRVEKAVEARLDDIPTVGAAPGAGVPWMDELEGKVDGITQQAKDLVAKRPPSPTPGNDPVPAEDAAPVAETPADDSTDTPGVVSEPVSDSVVESDPLPTLGAPTAPVTAAAPADAGVQPAAIPTA